MSINKTISEENIYQDAVQSFLPTVLKYFTVEEELFYFFPS